MDVLYETSFAKDLKRVNDKQLLQRVQETIASVKAADSLVDIRSVKKMQSYGNYYRIRLGDYRIGIEVTKEAVIFVRFLHRKDIYPKFP